ncbi:MAG: helicase-related protein, partial [Polymorphobacter sp.]
LVYLGRDPRERIEDAMARAVQRALATESGSILAFLPGAGEIERTAERLLLPAGVALHRLYGALDGGLQRAAIAPAAPGQRKVVLATSIAETSLTIDGVRVVIDSGLARRARFDRSTGLTHLVTERAAQAAVTQRAGRAGRTAPGVAWRLWEKAATGGMPRFDPPEILQADLAGLILDLACWGVTDPAQLRWLDPPPAVAVAQARETLLALAAIDADGRPTRHGRRMSALPLPPRLANMLLRAEPFGLTRCAAEVAVLLGEHALGGLDADLDGRLAALHHDRGVRATAARRLAARWAALVTAQPDRARDDAVGCVVALGYPDRVARRRKGEGNIYLMANGRAVRVVQSDALAGAEWLAVADASGSAESARLVAGATIDFASVNALFADQLRSEPRINFDPASGSVSAEQLDHFGAILLSRRPLASVAPALIDAALLAAVRRHGLPLLPWDAEADNLRHRIDFLRVLGATDLPDFGDAALMARLDDWLPPVLAGKRRLDAIAP